MSTLQATLHIQPEIFGYKTNFLTLSTVTVPYWQWTCSAGGGYDVRKLFGFLKSQFPYSYKEINKVLSHLSAVFRRCVRLQHAKLMLKCALWNGPHDWNSRTVEELEEDGDCSSSVCK